MKYKTFIGEDIKTSPIKVGGDDLRYYESDDINGLKLFSYVFKSAPNKLFCTLCNEDITKECRREYTRPVFDGKRLISDIQKEYPNAKVQIAEKRCLTKDEQEIDSDTYKSVILLEEQRVVLSITPCFSTENIVIYYSDFEMVRPIIDFIKKGEYYIKENIEIPSKEINFIVKTSNGYDLVSSEIKQMRVDVVKHYNDDFKVIDKKIVDFINEKNESGLIILKGEKGTGKTTYIRNLINTTERQFVYVTNAIANNLTDPSFISFLSRISGSVLVIEDCEGLLKSRNNGNFSSGISDLLNICDGLLSDIFNIKIIVTFNADISKIDDALTRKGRLKCMYDFGRLCPEKCNEIFKELGINHETNVAMPICEVFNFEEDNNNTAAENNRKIGF